MGRPCKCCGSEVECFCSCFCNPDNPNLKANQRNAVCQDSSGNDIRGDDIVISSERRRLFDLYDFTMLICNSNAIKDDEWEITLNKVNLGNVSELGEDACKGKFFTTSEKMLQKLKHDVFNDNSANVNLNSQLYCEYTPLCCMRNTFEQSEHKIVEKQTFNFCGANPIFFKRTKANYNGNFGSIIIFRTGPSEDHIDYFSHLFAPRFRCDTFQKMDQDGETRSYVRKNTQICTVHSGTYIIPSNFSEGGGVGQVFAPTVVQNCCFCNKSVSDFIDYRYGG